MHRTLKLSLPLLTGTVLIAASSLAAASWKDQPISQWTVDDAKQLLAASPWVKITKPEQIRDLSVGEREAGGDWDAGIGKGVGIAGTGILGSRREEDAIARAHAKPPVGDVIVRWESADPVRAAEQKTGETDSPTLDAGHYAIAVYDIAAPTRWNANNELKGIAYLRRDKNKDIKPSRVEILRQTDGLATVVYFFPRSAEITRKDGSVTFAAQIGRLFVTQFFTVAEMQLGGKLEL